MTFLRLTRLAAAIGVAAALAGCSLFRNDDNISLDDVPPADIFARGEAQLADGRAADAAQTFNEIERLYPFSQLAKRAIIMSAFSSYTARDFGNARATARRYLDLYPSDEDAPYAQHLIALTYYDNIVDVGRDQGTTQEALTALREVVSRYPNTDFARDAQYKIDLTLDHLAGKEMAVGRYYLKRGYYTAAINRFRSWSTSTTPRARPLRHCTGSSRPTWRWGWRTRRWRRRRFWGTTIRARNGTPTAMSCSPGATCCPRETRTGSSSAPIAA
jgi:outer membrane protein assembly factor BamD